MQTAIVILIFAAALFYIIRMIYKQVAPKNEGCGGNCKCGINADDMIKQADAKK